MSDEIKQLQDRLRKVEDDLLSERATRVANRRWVTGAGLLLLSWLGYTSFYQIPKAVDESNTGRVAHEAEEARDRAVKAAKQLSDIAADPLIRPEFGIISLPAGAGSKLRDGEGPRTESGTVYFRSAYKKFVDVHCALRTGDFANGTRFEIQTKVRDDRSGFDWTFRTWDGTKVWQGTIDWLAIGQ